MNRLRTRLSALLLAFSLISIASAQQATAPARDWSKEKARPVVDWARDGVVYEVWQRAFSPAGDFNGITARLDDLKKTGVDILWLMPLNPIGEKGKKGTIGSPYAVRDYYGVNPAYGTKDDLKRLVKEAHARNMKVIVDVVFNHTAWDNKLLAEHPDWYHKGKDGKPTYPFDWTDIAWLDYSSPALRAYILDVMKHWLVEYQLDGFRCDVAHLVPVDFWEQARTELQKINPNIYMLAEAHEPSHMVRAFDTDYSWPLMGAITDVFQGRKPATALREEWQKEVDTFPQGTQHLRISDDHDESRAIIRLGQKGALAAQAFVFTLDGIPLVYNGMEVGDSAESGAPALFEKVPITWNISERRPEFPRFYRQMIALRKSSEAMRRGDLKWIPNTEENKVITFTRTSATEQMFVVINTSNRPVSVMASSMPANGWTDVTPNLEKDEATQAAAASGSAFSLEPYGFRILKRAQAAN